MKYSNPFLTFIIVIFLIISGCASTTPLIKASKEGNSLAVQKLLDAGANINEPDNGGYNALFYAVEYGQLDVAKYLISKGANLESKDPEGMTPLVYAVSYDRNADIINLLIKSGADINAKRPDGESVTDLALSATKGNIVDDIIKIRNINLWSPEAGKARLFFVGTGLWDYLKVNVGKQTKGLNQYKYVGLIFFDVDSGTHSIGVKDLHATSATATQTTSIDVVAGQTYYFEVTQDMTRRIWHYAGIKLSNVMIKPLAEVEAKQRIKEILKSKELNEEKIANPPVATEITKLPLPKTTDSNVKKTSSEPSGYGQKLRELKKLKDEGLLTNEEYEQKRKAIVDGL